MSNNICILGMGTPRPHPFLQSRITWIVGRRLKWYKSQLPIQKMKSPKNLDSLGHFKTPVWIIFTIELCFIVDISFTTTTFENIHKGDSGIVGGTFHVEVPESRVCKVTVSSPIAYSHKRLHCWDFGYETDNHSLCPQPGHGALSVGNGAKQSFN